MDKAAFFSELAIGAEIQRAAATNNTPPNEVRALIGANAADKFADKIRSGELLPEDAPELLRVLAGLTGSGHETEASRAFIVQLARELQPDVAPA